jgi:S-DNA-T family DNA segregation ATPase FtsK/SpoIIIE
VQFRYGSADVELQRETAQARVADLAAALGTPGPDLWIDGRPVAGSVALDQSGLLTGSTVAGADQHISTVDQPVAAVRVIGGLDAGLRLPVGPGPVLIGRGSTAAVRLTDTGAGREHCVIDIAGAGRATVRDLGSSNGTDVNGVRVGGPVAVAADDVINVAGSVLLQVVPSTEDSGGLDLDPAHESGPDGTIPYPRSPRVATVSPSTSVRAPVLPVRRSSTTFAVTSIAAPLLIAGITVVLLHDVRYALFALLSPVMLLANLVETRTRGRWSLRRQARQYARDLASLGETLESLRRQEIHRRRDALPDPSRLLFQAQAPGPRLWERRAGPGPKTHDDFLVLSAGFGELPWSVPLAGPPDEASAEVRELLARYATLPMVPVPVELAGGGVVGLSGDAAATRAVARGLLVQAAVTSGPADLAIAVLVDVDRIDEWEWAKWLPHTVDHRRGGSARLLAAGERAQDELADRLVQLSEAERRTLLVVVDAVAPRSRALRDLLGGGVASAIVLTRHLPAQCRAIIEVRDDGRARLRRPPLAQEMPLLATGVSLSTMDTLARALARFSDPDLTVAGAGLPTTVSLLQLLQLGEPLPDAVIAQWRQAASSLRAVATLGVTEPGVFRVDLDRDGPHGLIAGATRSGKSELLLTLVASLALDNDPEHLAFALVDYKGGTAFTKVAGLPHVAGEVVTDLDEQLAERALRCLRAELRHRERLLREARLPSGGIREYQRSRATDRPDLPPMPRLVVVIDEFATLANEIPSFVDSVVDVAARGAGLGVHLVMATQRPAGSVGEAIRANVRLRIALRVQSAADSQDVLGSPAAAMVEHPGRGYHLVRPGVVQAIQVALASVASAGPAAAPVTLTPFRFTPRPVDVAATAGQATDLERLVSAAREAFERSGAPPPRPPWPPPLPYQLDLAGLPEVAERGLQTESSGLTAVALADDPERQQQYPVGWDLAAGNLLLYGVVGAGTTTTLATIGLALARRYPPDQQHLYILDLGAGGLAPLADLVHCGQYVAAGAREEQIGLVRLLAAELRRRAAANERTPGITVLVDGIGSFVSDFETTTFGLGVLDDLYRVYADGSQVGITFAVTADRVGAVPHAWAAQTPQKLLFQLASVDDFGAFGVHRREVPRFAPGRAVTAVNRRVVQLAWPGPSLESTVDSVVRRWPGRGRSAPPVPVLPSRVAWTSLGARARTGSSPWWIPFGLGGRTPRPVGFTLYEHEHALIAGPPRSGRSTALCTLAAALTAAEQPPSVVAFAPRPSPLREAPGLAALVTQADELPAAVAGLTGPLAVLIDDVDPERDPGGVLSDLGTRDAVHLIVAGRPDVVRRAYSGWLRKVRESHCVLLLRPDVQMDSDLAGLTLPRIEGLPNLPGRGYLAFDGQLEQVHVAYPEPSGSRLRNGPS